MTHIVPLSIKTKKALREAVEAGQNVWLDDPSMFSPVSGNAIDLVERLGDIVCTNHPKRSWFARITKNKHGKVVVL